MGGDGVAFHSQTTHAAPTPTRLTVAAIAASLLILFLPALTHASGEPEKVERTYVTAPPAPAFQTWEQADAKSAGCVSCHTASDRKTMHASPAVVLGCTDCHGGDPTVFGSNPAVAGPAPAAARFPRGGTHPASRGE